TKTDNSYADIYLLRPRTCMEQTVQETLAHSQNTTEGKYIGVLEVLSFFGSLQTNMTQIPGDKSETVSDATIKGR
ncbi:hypothetical protein J6590_104301, partial [Homalodisca vitripennis]